ncbi:hypothetical protein EON66_03880 [archaeon]|nr:MAG: hypothetical protein EON66_03880 [archaeon]
MCNADATNLHAPCTLYAGVDDAAELECVREALISVGIDAKMQHGMFTILSGLLHLGNVRFEENERGEAVLATPRSAEYAAQLLGVELLPEKLVKRLVRVKGRTSVYEVNLTSRQAAVARDALAKTTYERLFTWIISKSNASLTSRSVSTGFIGILDIFGFEIFEHNSFEQLCINYANEKLQNLFNHHIFVMEQEQYRMEEVDVTTIEFINNQPCVDLIEKRPTGILTILDEICFLGRETTDTEFLDRLDKMHKVSGLSTCVVCAHAN